MEIRENRLQNGKLIYKVGILLTKVAFRLQKGIFALQTGLSGYNSPKEYTWKGIKPDKTLKTIPEMI